MKNKNIARIQLTLLASTVTLLLLGCAKDEDAVPIPKHFTAIAAGARHSLAVEDDGSLWTWGDNAAGQLGDGNIGYLFSRDTPFKIGSGYKKIAAGGSHSLALKSNGTLWAWGGNDYGQLGNGTIGYGTNIATPVIIGNDFAEISAGANHSLAIKTDGTLWAWGSINYSPTGDSIWPDLSIPVEIGQGYSAISAGNGYSLAINSAGALWAWGTNDHGRLGNGSNNHMFTPILVGFGYIAIADGGDHTLALKSDNSLWAWGGNEYGQLGDGTSGYGVEIYTPIQVGSGYQAIAAGEYHSVALKSDGSLWTWGLNSVDQLGIGTGSNGSSTPKKIGSDYSVISTGASHSIALKKDGTMWAWGWNIYGQVGIGPGWSGKIPTQIGED